MTARASSSGRLFRSGPTLLAGAAALLGLAILPRLMPEPGGMIGKPAPEVVFAVAANGEPGKRTSLADLRGKPVLLDFWASWCGPCAMVAPTVDRIAHRYERKGLVVMGVNVDDPPEVIRAYVRAKGLAYPMTIDVGKRASMAYGVDKLPSLVLIDRDGNVRAFLTGLVDEASLDEAVSAML